MVLFWPRSFTASVCSFVQHPGRFVHLFLYYWWGNPYPQNQHQQLPIVATIKHRHQPQSIPPNPAPVSIPASTSSSLPPNNRHEREKTTYIIWSNKLWRSELVQPAVTQTVPTTSVCTRTHSPWTSLNHGLNSGVGKMAKTQLEIGNIRWMHQKKNLLQMQNKVSF